MITSSKSKPTTNNYNNIKNFANNANQNFANSMMKNQQPLNNNNYKRSNLNTLNNNKNIQNRQYQLSTPSLANLYSASIPSAKIAKLINQPKTKSDSTLTSSKNNGKTNNYKPSKPTSSTI